MEGWKRGCIRFYASAQCVPPGLRYLVLPPCFDNTDFSEAAAFIISFLLWPFANLSLGLETTNAVHDTVHTQVFTWYGTTTVIPGGLEIDVVLHMSNMGRVASMGRDDEPVLTARPTMGRTVVEFWPPYAAILINYCANQSHYVLAAAFAISWAQTFSPGTINDTLQKIATAGLFHKVDRWVNEAHILSMAHAGVLTTDCAMLHSKLLDNDDTGPRVHNTNAVDGDSVPLLYRCWRANGVRAQHVPPNVNWCNI